jgi:transcriptional regulator with XRE-family HTH domain
MVHKGQEIEKAIRQSGYSITEIAKRLHISRRHLYNIFKMEQPDPSIIIKLEKLLRVPLTLYQHYPESFAGNIEDMEIEYSKENGPLLKQIHYWKEKYILLLEEYNQLLKQINH